MVIQKITTLVIFRQIVINVRRNSVIVVSDISRRKHLEGISPHAVMGVYLSLFFRTI